MFKEFKFKMKVLPDKQKEICILKEIKKDMKLLKKWLMKQLKSINN